MTRDQSAVGIERTDPKADEYALTRKVCPKCGEWQGATQWPKHIRSCNQ